MNIKAALKYRLYESKKSVIIFYLAVAALILLISTTIITIKTTEGKTNCLEIATIVFLLILGLNSFRETFRFFMQNGISRKAIISSQIMCSLILCLAMSLIDNIILVIGKNLLTFGGRLDFIGMLELMYGPQNSAVAAFPVSFLFCFSIYSMVSALGFLITTLYYRMNKGQKIAVSVGVPAALLFVLPAMDKYIFRFAISNVFAKVIRFAFEAPANAVVSGIVLSAAFYGFSWLLARKAVIKD